MIARTILLLLAIAESTRALSLPGADSRTNAKPVGVQSRRQALTFTVAGVASAAFGFQNEAAWAAASPPTEAELERIRVGYKQIQYLLDNFEQETTICRENGGECKRDADAIRRALGLRTTTDPLFQIEKVFAKGKYMDIDPDNLDAYFEAVEEWESAVSMSNSMAFISQFGEYNPGGGADQVLKFLNESKKQVLAAEKSLGTIIRCLNL